VSAFRRLVLVFFFGWMGLASGRDLPGWLQDENIPPAPPERVTDDSGFLAQNPGALERMRAAVQRLEKERGFRIFVVIHSVLMDSNSQVLAGRLQEAWVPDGNGMVLVYESDSKSLSMGRGYESDPGSASPRGTIPSHEMLGIIEKAMRGTDNSLTPDRYIEALTLKLTEECQAYFRRGDEPLPRGRTARLIALSLGIGAVVALIALGLGQVVRRSGGGGSHTYEFPETDLPQRLGAPYGGGKVIVCRFGQKA